MAGVDVIVLIVCAVVLRSRLAITLICLLLPPVVFVLGGAYRRPRLSLSALNDMRSVLTAATLPLVTISILDLDLRETGSRHILPVVIIPSLVLSRLASYAVLRRLRCIYGGRSTVIVGSGLIAGRIIETLMSDNSFGLTPVGFIDQGSARHPPSVPRLGSLDEFEEILVRTRAECVIVAFSSSTDRSLVRQMRTMRNPRTEFFLVPRLFQAGASSGDMRTEDCGGTPLVWLPNRAWRREQLILKRLGDVLMASTLLVLTSPIMLITACAVRSTTPGPILFRQQRVGRNGHPFQMLKFRSMLHDPHAVPVQGGGGNPRITRVGQFIRRTSIDELPQLVNVLAGSMSMVGPRPELPAFVEMTGELVPDYADRHRVQVGMTGWAQIHRLRGVGTSLEQRALFDNYYIDHWSLWRDVCIVLRTMSVIVRGS
jgi:exopolysaccharide biosynthesis polyprenyl glycosylphosphotransferase